MDTTFSHFYECDQLTELQHSSRPHYYFPGATTKGGGDGLLVEVRPRDCEAWLGTFAFGRVSPTGLSGLYATPDPDRLCVVARGDGYFVSASNPEVWESVGAQPVTDVRIVHAHRIIVFADFTRLWAYGPSGLKWKTGRLAWSGFKITEVTDTTMLGEFWDPSREEAATFAVDLANGSHHGGAQVR
jgi:hypothetical protein